MEGGIAGQDRTGQRVRLEGSLQKAHTVSRVVGARLGVVMVAEMAHSFNGLNGGNWLFLLLVAAAGGRSAPRSGGSCSKLGKSDGPAIRLGRRDLDLNVWEKHVSYRVSLLEPTRPPPFLFPLLFPSSFLHASCFRNPHTFVLSTIVCHSLLLLIAPTSNCYTHSLNAPLSPTPNTREFLI